MLEKIYSQLTEKMEKTLTALKDEYATFRTGRANAPRRSATSSTGRCRLPKAALSKRANYNWNCRWKPLPWSLNWTPGALNEINKAIQKSDIGINPQVDGNIIRLNVPPLTGERRQELVKVVKKKSEEYKIAVRNHRRDILENIKKSKNDAEITEDDFKKANDKIQKITDQYIIKIDEVTESKNKDILTA